MTSVLPDEEESNVTRLKQKSQPHTMDKTCIRTDESRTFLKFSRENLSLSNPDLEQGFNKSYTRYFINNLNKQTILSCAALLLALTCISIELWKLRKVIKNANDIDILRRDVDTLKHRFLEKDLLDELRAFEEQLYSEGISEEDELSNLSSSDYDSNYDDTPNPSSTSTYKSSITTSSETITNNPTTRSPLIPCTSKDLEDVLAVLRRAEAERARDFERNIHERERLLEDERLTNMRITNEHESVNDEKVKNKQDAGLTNVLNKRLMQSIRK